MYDYRCRILSVVDGDTVDCEIDLGFTIKMQRRVRLLGINAPEMKAPTMEQAKASRLALQMYFNTMMPVIVHTQLDKSDAFGRVLGTFFVGSLNVNQDMLNSGHAVVYKG